MNRPTEPEHGFAAGRAALGSDRDDLRPAERRGAGGPAAGADRDDLRPVRPGGRRLAQRRALIRLMAELGADEPAVRSSISRLKQRGLLEPRRADGRSRVRGSPAAGRVNPGRGRPADFRAAARPAGRRLAAGRIQRARAAAGQEARAAVPAGLARLRLGGGRGLDRARPPGRRDHDVLEQRRAGRVRQPVHAPATWPSVTSAARSAGGGTWTGWSSCTRPSSTAPGRCCPAGSGQRRAAPRAGVRRLRPGADRLAPAAVPRSRPAPRTAAQRLARLRAAAAFAPLRAAGRSGPRPCAEVTGGPPGSPAVTG